MRTSLTFVSLLVRAVLLGWVVGVCLAPSNTAARTPHPADRGAERPPLVVVRALGPLRATDLRHACRTLLDAYPVRCEIRTGHRLGDHAAAWHAERAQLDGRVALDQLFQARSGDALVELTITHVDVFELGKPYVFGLASVSDRVALVSTARISHAPEKLTRRLTKLVLHEVGHALGLVHHPHANCVMRQDATPESLDDAPTALCEHCHRLMLRQVAFLRRPGQVALDRTRGHLVRGQHELARRRLAHALHRGEFDARLLNDVALTFMHAKAWNEAVSILRFVVKQAPEFAHAHANLGIALEKRARPGDLSLAMFHLERALAIQPNWNRLAGHLAALRLGAASAQGPGS